MPGSCHPDITTLEESHLLNFKCLVTPLAFIPAKVDFEFQSTLKETLVFTHKKTRTRDYHAQVLNSVDTRA